MGSDLIVFGGTGTYNLPVSGSLRCFTVATASVQPVIFNSTWTGFTEAFGTGLVLANAD